MVSRRVQRGLIHAVGSAPDNMMDVRHIFVDWKNNSSDSEQISFIGDLCANQSNQTSMAQSHERPINSHKKWSKRIVINTEKLSRWQNKV